MTEESRKETSREDSENELTGPWNTYFNGLRAGTLYWNGLIQSQLELIVPFIKAQSFFWEAERDNVPRKSFSENASDYRTLIRENLALAHAFWFGAFKQMSDFHLDECTDLVRAWIHTISNRDGEKLEDYWAGLAEAIKQLVVDLPDAMKAVESQYGFHFDEGRYVKIAQTDRMDLYQVLPTEPGIQVNDAIKPILIAHPYVLGANILAFLPGKRRSFVHCFANHGIPTYVRIVKDIHSHEAVQRMAGEQDVEDTRRFCEILKQKHEKPVTLCGVCQAGFIITAGVLTGELDGLVDAVITCVSPLDGTLSRHLHSYLESIAPRFRTLAYSTKTLPNGNRVVDATVMAWVYKLKSLKHELPLDYYRRLEQFRRQVRKGKSGVTTSTAAILRWLIIDRTDIPVEVTRLSTTSYSIPVTADGDLPVKLFGRKLNFKYLKEKGIPLQICYGAHDMLVEPPSSLIAAKFVDADLAAFPRGHAAILTSWSNPDSEYALHKTFANGQRGPVKYHLDLDAALTAKTP